jgi:PAS domain S-box-containing protein
MFGVYTTNIEGMVLPMEKREKKALEVLKTVSEAETTENLSEEIAQDALSIVIDAINSTVGGLIITDLNGTISFTNPAFCKMFEYSHNEIVGKNAANLFATREVRKLSDVVAIIDISQENTEEFVVETKAGRSLIVEVAASNVTSSSGKLVGRMASFVDITKRKEVEADRENLITKLQDALAKIRTLRGIIPICSSCKKIRDDKGYWNQIENYISEHSDANFSHGICPECAKKLYPEFHNQTSPNNRLKSDCNSAAIHYSRLAAG